MLIACPLTLRERFPDVKGFSPRNLRYRRTFAEVWPRTSLIEVLRALISEEMGVATKTTWCANAHFPTG